MFTQQMRAAPEVKCLLPKKLCLSEILPPLIKVLLLKAMSKYKREDHERQRSNQSPAGCSDSLLHHCLHSYQSNQFAAARAEQTPT